MLRIDLMADCGFCKLLFAFFAEWSGALKLCAERGQEIVTHHCDD